MAKDNIATWEIQHSTVDWDYSKTQTLLGTLKIRNRPRWVEFYAYLEAEHSFPQVGCVRNKLSFLTVPLNLKLLAGLRMDVIPAVDLLDLVIEGLHSSLD